MFTSFGAKDSQRRTTSQDLTNTETQTVGISKIPRRIAPVLVTPSFWLVLSLFSPRLGWAGPTFGDLATSMYAGISVKLIADSASVTPKSASTGKLSPRSSVISATTAQSAATTLRVGPNRKYKTISEALNAAEDGYMIEIDAGVYANETITILKNDLTLRGVGGYAHLKWGTGNYLSNTATISNGKGILVIEGNNTTIENIEVSGATVVDANGAGIRYKGGNLTIRRSYFHDNENGILGQGGLSNSLLIENSIFERNGYCLMACSHNVYIGRMGKLIFRYNKSVDAHEGHILKSRAEVNEIIGNYFSTKNSDGSYEAEFPNGGTVYFIGNVVEQGVNTGNPIMLSYGFEGVSNRNPELYVVNNTFYNLLGSGTFIKLNGSPTAFVRNNIFGGGGAIGVSVDASNKVLTQRDFVNVSQSNYHLVSGSSAIDAGTEAGAINGFDLTPQFEYVEPADSQRRVTRGARIDAGAYEFSGSSSVSSVQPTTATLSANPSSVALGKASTLIWSSSNATSCKASDGWSGEKAVSGSESTGNLVTDTVFTLTCTGDAGSTSQSVMVTVTGSPP